MDLLPNENLAYELLPFVRHWASSPARWSTLRTVFQALEWACRSVVTQNHRTLFALLCSLLHRASAPGPDAVAIRQPPFGASRSHIRRLS